MELLKVFMIFGFLLLLAAGEPENDGSHENIIIDELDGSMKMGQKVAEEKLVKKKKKVFNITEHILVSKKLSDGRPYAVYDGIISAKAQILVKTFVSYDDDSWMFNNYDDDGVNKQRTYDNTPWINDQDPLEFSSTHLYQRLLTAVKDTSKDDGPYYPYRVFGKIIRRGDHTRVSTDSSDEGDFTAMIFVNDFWRKNYYGELYLYDKNKEIIGGATHKPGRVVVWEGTMYRLNRPPAIQFLHGQILFQVQFTKNESKMEAGHKKWLEYQMEKEEANKKWFLPDYKQPNGEPLSVPNLGEKLKFEYTTKKDGRKIFVYDDLFSEDLLNHLREHVLKYGSYFYDDSIDKDSDNVQWIAGYLLDPYIKSPYWKIKKQVAEHATGSSFMFPYDVSINLVRSSDHTRIHEDVSYYGEEEFTCLVYLNPNWTKNNYGETTFFENNSDDTEIVAQVRPRYGRTVIFDGNIPHSARPPSFNFTGARLTFVTKLQKNEYTGRTKNLVEESRHFMSIANLFHQVHALASRKGEAFARHQLDELRKMKEEMAYHPDANEEEDKDDEEDNEEDNEKKMKSSPKEDVFQDVYSMLSLNDEDENPNVLELFSPLKGVTEKSPNALEIIKEVHTAMVEKHREFKKAFIKKLLHVL